MNWLSSIYRELQSLIKAIGLDDVTATVIFGVFTIISAVIISIYKGTALLWRAGRGRTYVKFPRGGKDPDLEQFKELYEQLFEPQIRISCEEIIAWLDDPARWNGLGQKLFLCKQNNVLIGLAQLMYCPDTPYVFISYFGVDKNASDKQRLASKLLVKAITKFASRHLKCHEAIIFEVESPTLSGLSSAQISERKAKIRRMKEFARNSQACAFEISMDYLQPEFPNDGSTSNTNHLRLLYIVHQDKKNISSLDKSTVMEIIRFVYTRVYGPAFQRDPELDLIYREELREYMRHYYTTLPQEVKLIP